MSAFTPKDGFNRPAVLGDWQGCAVPLSVLEDGTVRTIGGCRFELVESLRIDLTTARVKERHDVSFDCFAVARILGGFSLFIGSDDDSKRCDIDKCLSVDVSADKVFFSNEPQQNAFAHLWFFKLKEEI